MRAGFVLSCLLCCALTACAGSRNYTPQDYLLKKELNGLQTWESFQHCYDYGCKHVANVALDNRERTIITAPFTAINDAETERKAIAASIGLFETIIGAKTGTENDKAGTYESIAPKSHDCVDESINTAIYLMLLQKAGYIKYHRLHAPSVRVPFMYGKFAPHQTSSITEIATDERYAVDSWFHDNGHPAEIIPFTTWKKGWAPPEKQYKDQEN